jgi:hypothetical protein
MLALQFSLDSVALVLISTS